MFARGFYVIFISALCVFTILVELSFDSTSSFVRVVADAASVIAESTGDSTRPLKDKSTSPADDASAEAPVTCSISHSASVATPFSFEPLFESHALVLTGWLAPRDPEAFVILRPPIA